MSAAVLNDSLFRFFKWRTEANLLKKVALALFFAALTGLAAQVRIPLSFSPVPITGQTFAVLLSAVILGKRWGGISQIMYVSLGVLGLPWFANLAGGLAILMGPTGGYLMGFVLASFFIGHIVDTMPSTRRFIPMFGLMLFSTFALIFIPGLFHLSLWMHFVQGETPETMAILSMGFFPFIVGAIIKSFFAASVASAITPKQNFLK